MRKIEDLTIWMMGASGGIGSACALQLARPGIKLGICSIDASGLEELGKKLEEKGAAVFAQVVDVCSESQVQSFMQEAAGRLGAADVLINFAGLSVTATAEQLSEADYDKVMDVNVKGMFFGVKHFVPLVEQDKGALIINFGSMAAKRANPAAPHYSAAKAAVNLFSQGLAEQLKSRNIRVTVFNPGPTNTTFFAGRIPPERRVKFMQAQDVAEVMEFIISRDSRIVFHDVMFESFEYFSR